MNRITDDHYASSHRALMRKNKRELQILALLIVLTPFWWLGLVVAADWATHYL